MDKESRSALTSDLVEAGFGEESLLELNDSQLQKLHTKEIIAQDKNIPKVNPGVNQASGGIIKKYSYGGRVAKSSAEKS